MKSLPLLHDPPPRVKSRPPRSFEQTLTDHGVFSLTAGSIETLQVNVGKLCNQTCHHCHVDAGPQRTEIMTRDTIDQILRVLKNTPQISTVDITGGAPEMNPHFEYLVQGCSELGRHVIDRCNLTVFFVKGKGHLPRFLCRPPGGDHCLFTMLLRRKRGSSTWERGL